MESRSSSHGSSSGMETTSRSHSPKRRSASRERKSTHDLKGNERRHYHERPRSPHASPRRRAYSPHQRRGSGQGTYKSSRYRSDYNSPPRRYDRYSPYRRRDSSYDRYKRGGYGSSDLHQRHDSAHDRRRRYDSPNDSRRPRVDSSHDSRGDRDAKPVKSRRDRSESLALSKDHSPGACKSPEKGSSTKGHARENEDHDRSRTHSAEKSERHRIPARKSPSPQKRSSSTNEAKYSAERLAKKTSDSPSSRTRGKKVPEKRHHDVKRRRGSHTNSSSSSPYSRHSNSQHRALKKYRHSTQEKHAPSSRKEYSKSPTSKRHSSHGRHPSTEKERPKLYQVCVELNEIKNMRSSSERRQAIEAFMAKYTDPHSFAYETPDAERHSPESYEKAVIHSNPSTITRRILIPGPDNSSFCLEMEWSSTKETSLITLYAWTDKRLSRVYEFHDTAELSLPHRNVDLQTIVKNKVWAICRRYLLKKGVEQDTKCTFWDCSSKSAHQETFLL